MDKILDAKGFSFRSFIIVLRSSRTGSGEKLRRRGEIIRRGCLDSVNSSVTQRSQGRKTGGRVAAAEEMMGGNGEESPVYDGAKTLESEMTRSSQRIGLK